jgi:hypothetical protein
LTSLRLGGVTIKVRCVRHQALRREPIDGLNLVALPPVWLEDPVSGESDA